MNMTIAPSTGARAGVAALLLCGTALFAQPAAAQSAFGDFFEREKLTGDWGGARTALEEKGLTFEATFTADSSLNATGGRRTGKGFSSLLQLGLTLDLEKAVGWTGGEIYAGAYFIRGHGLSAFETFNLLTVSNIEAPHADALGEVYFKQALFDDKVEIKVGQLAADGDFATSDTAALFVNATFGWPGLFGVDITNGGPAYPFPTPGVHGLVKFDDAWSFQAGLYNGDPVGPDGVNRHNLEFPVNRGAFAIGELIYTNDVTLPGSYKIGVWYSSKTFADIRTGVANRDDNYALYGVIDQTVWKSGDLKDPSPASLSVFARLAIAPQSNRNFIDAYFDAGFNFKGVPGRPADVFGVAFGYGHTSNKDPNPFSKDEMVVEASYQAAVTGWLKVQPYFQYLINPGGGAPNPNSNRRIRDAAVFGFRTQVEF